MYHQLWTDWQVLTPLPCNIKWKPQDEADLQARVSRDISSEPCCLIDCASFGWVTVRERGLPVEMCIRDKHWGQELQNPYLVVLVLSLVCCCLGREKAASVRSRELAAAERLPGMN